MKRWIKRVLLTVLLLLNVIVIANLFAYEDQDFICCLCPRQNECKNDPEKSLSIFGLFEEAQNNCDQAYCPPERPEYQYYGQCQPANNQPWCCIDVKLKLGCEEIDTGRINCNHTCSSSEK